MPNVTVMVKPQHIDGAECVDPHECAVAHAINDVLRQGVIATVLGPYFRVATIDNDGNPHYITGDIPMPREAFRKIVVFDNNGGMEPFVFEANIPAHCLPQRK